MENIFLINFFVSLCIMLRGYEHYQLQCLYIVGVIHNGDLLRIICLLYFDMSNRFVDMYTYQKSEFGGVMLGFIWIV
jgi:hypothetical protein